MIKNRFLDQIKIPYNSIFQTKQVPYEFKITFEYKMCKINDNIL